MGGDIVQAMQCIRCGSKDHTTRDHDEGKAGKSMEKPKPKAAPRPTAAAPALDSKTGRPVIAKVQHPKCWSNPTRRDSIPDCVDRPLRERFYHDPEAESWFHRTECECKECEKKRAKRQLDWDRRFNKKA